MEDPMTDYIAEDTYTGHHTVRSNTKRSDVFTARELAEMSKGEIRVFWEYHGTVRGVALYGRTRFIGQPDGSLIGYCANGSRSIIHPADRKVRVITN